MSHKLDSGFLNSISEHPDVPAAAMKKPWNSDCEHNGLIFLRYASARMYHSLGLQYSDVTHFVLQEL